MQKGLGNMMKQAQQMHAKMQEIQKELADKKVEAESGGGMVKVTANGKGEILSIRIEKEIIKQEEKEVLEDLVLVAINEVLRRSQELNTSEMSKVTGGLKIPGLFT
jgi:DNA-binding YbaB/EbfC family protein